MREAALLLVVKEICGRDKRYKADGYLFVLEALEFTAKLLNKPAKAGRERHVAGRELLEGIRQYALQEYGPMALRVLGSWGIRQTEDFGEIVFNLVESGKLRKTEEDTRADFANGYDFTEAFTLPFLPERPPESGMSKRHSRKGSDAPPRASGA